MNVGESNAVFTLLAYLCPSTSGREPVSEEDALAVAVMLADSAHRGLSAGPDGRQVARAWRKHRPGPKQ